MTFCRIFRGLHLKRFWQREDGAVTVDWVVLTAATVGLAIGIWSVITDSLFDNAAVAINSDIQEAAQR